MKTTEINLETIVAWSQPKFVPNTTRGPRMARSGVPGEDFWHAWRADRNALKSAGIAVGKNAKTGDWEVTWWTNPPEDVVHELEANREASRAHESDADLPAPEGKSYMPFQKASIAGSIRMFTSSPSGCVKGVLLGDDMGLGKTVQAIGIINSTPNVRKVLVICPTQVKLHWEHHMKEWLMHHLTVGIAKGGKYWPDTQVVIMNWEILVKHQERIAEKWDVCIADESHLVSNYRAQRTKLWQKIDARYRLALTGTPIMNHTMDIYPTLKWIAPHRFPNPISFKKKFTDGRDGSTNMQRSLLQDRLRESVLIRRKKADVMKELPSIIRQVIDIDPPEWMDLDEVRIANENEERLTELEAALELAKVSDDPRVYKEALALLRDGVRVSIDQMAEALHNTEKAKVPITCDHIESCLKSGVKKIVVFGHHRDCLEMMNAHFPGSVLYYGGLSEGEKDRIVRRFTGEDDCQIFFGGLKAAGTGLDGLQRVCSHCIFHSMWWNPAIINQAIARIHRIGASGSGPALAQFIVISGTSDANMAHKLVKKEELADQTLDSPSHITDAEEPITPTKVNIKGSIKTTAKELEQVVPIDSVAAIHSCLQMLAGVCDGARQIDGHGFNKFDSHIGKDLAGRSRISNSQAILGRKLVRKYKRQLPEELVTKAIAI